MEAPEFANAMFLIKNGIPFDVAFAGAPDFTMAAAVVLADFEGHDFDWNTLKFSKRG